MNTADWIVQRVARLQSAPATHPRSTRERLRATLRQEPEALSPRALRHVLDDLRAIVDPLVSEVEGGRRAQAVMDWYTSAPAPQRRDLWLLMSERFMADPLQVKQAQ
ncbi:MAG: malonyl-CoA decarboxylase, partial [Hydrogenophaga sp.]|nr:malonyl-CoA decarboxylase [Hydrogenophaga sp.]